MQYGLNVENLMKQLKIKVMEKAIRKKHASKWQK